MARPRGNDRDLAWLLGSGSVPSGPEPMPRRGRPPIAAPPVETVDADVRVLGLDLALTTGWAVLDQGPTRLVACGEFGLPAAPHVQERRPAFLLRRGDVLTVVLRKLLDVYAPHVVVYDFQDMARPAWSGGPKGREQLVSLALGIIEAFFLRAMEADGRLVLAVASRSARQAVSGAPGATKQHVRLSACALLDIDSRRTGTLTDNMIDAAAIGLAVLPSTSVATRLRATGG